MIGYLHDKIWTCKLQKNMANHEYKMDVPNIVGFRVGVATFNKIELNR